VSPHRGGGKNVKTILKAAELHAGSKYVNKVIDCLFIQSAMPRPVGLG
jgi:hypothetical protein